MTNLKKALEAVDKDVCRQFDNDGYVEMTWLCQTPERAVIIPAPPGNVPKDVLVEAIKEVFQSLNVVRYVFVTESWSLALSPDDEPPAKVAGHPDAVETVTMTGEDLTTGEMLFRSRTIHRPADGPPYLGEPTDSDTSMSGGLFCNLLTKPTTH